MRQLQACRLACRPRFSLLADSCVHECPALPDWASRCRYSLLWNDGLKSRMLKVRHSPALHSVAAASPHMPMLCQLHVMSAAGVHSRSLFPFQGCCHPPVLPVLLQRVAADELGIPDDELEGRLQKVQVRCGGCCRAQSVYLDRRHRPTVWRYLHFSGIYTSALPLPPLPGPAARDPAEAGQHAAAAGGPAGSRRGQPARCAHRWR